jgi:hypothetical protein
MNGATTQMFKSYTYKVDYVTDLKMPCVNMQY